jgi:hypothetical protein
MSCGTDFAGEQSPAHVRHEQIQAVSLTISADFVDFPARDHRGDLGAVPANLARQTNGGRGVLQRHPRAPAII